MLKSKDYETKEMKPKDAEPVVEAVVEVKADKPKATNLSERISALEKVVYDVVVLDEDGNAKKFRKRFRR